MDMEGYLSLLFIVATQLALCLSFFAFIFLFSSPLSTFTTFFAILVSKYTIKHLSLKTKTDFIGMGTFNAKPSAYVAGQWIPDNQADECFGCQEEFTVTLRRHHCRCCGEVFCADCWGTQVNLPADYGYDGPVKLCTVCASMFEGSLRCLRMARRIVVTRHANLPHQLANNTATTPQGSSHVMGRELSSTLGGGSVVQTDRSIIVTGSSRCLEAQLHQTISQAATNTPPLCRDNMRKGAFEVFFLKLVHWRPFFIGKPGWVRSSAWIWLFSSIESTTAWSGGLT